MSGPNIYAKWGGRRFLLTLGCGIVCTLLVREDTIPPEVFENLIIWTVAAYIGGNSAQKIWESKKPND